MKTHKQEMFELWWGSYQVPRPEEILTQDFQDAFEAGYKYGQDIGRVQGHKAAKARFISIMEEADSWGGRR